MPEEEPHCPFCVKMAIQNNRLNLVYLMAEEKGIVFHSTDMDVAVKNNYLAMARYMYSLGVYPTNAAYNYAKTFRFNDMAALIEKNGVIDFHSCDVEHPQPSVTRAYVIA